MRILHCIPDLVMASGPTVFCVEVCDHLAFHRSDEVALFAGGSQDETCSLPRSSRVRLYRKMHELSEWGQPDLLHIHSIWAPFSHRSACLARQHRIPYVVSTHGMLAPWALKHKWLKKKIAWWLYQKRDLKNAAMFHVTADCEIKWLKKLGFLQPCVTAPLGSDLPDILDYAAKNNDVKRVLFVGRIYPVKGLINLIKAWAALKGNESGACSAANEEKSGTKPLKAGSSLLTVNGSPWQLVIVGPDQAGHKSELVSEASRLGLKVEDSSTNALMNSRSNELRSDIIFTGAAYGNEKDALHRLADLFVLPSFTENFGVVVTDALAYGIPVITTKGTPWAELLGHSDGSLVHYCESALVGEQEDGRRRLEVSDQGAIDIDNSSTNAIMNSLTNELAATGRSGWWIDIGVEPLVKALQDAMTLNDAERHAMGVNGRKLVKEKYSWEAIALEMKHAYAWLLIGGDLPDCVRVD